LLSSLHMLEIGQASAEVRCTHYIISFYDI
jgi:hypothetical protein